MYLAMMVNIMYNKFHCLTYHFRLEIIVIIYFVIQKAGKINLQSNI
jgi:hypothetical protein